MLSKSELREACEAVEKAAAASEMMQILREMLPTLSPEHCPAEARQDWLDLHLMIQPRPCAPASANWFTRLGAWMSKLRVGCCWPWAMCSVRCSHAVPAR